MGGWERKVEQYRVKWIGVCRERMKEEGKNKVKNFFLILKKSKNVNFKKLK
jgi:hypothetical protein